MGSARHLFANVVRDYDWGILPVPVSTSFEGQAIRAEPDLDDLRAMRPPPFTALVGVAARVHGIGCYELCRLHNQRAMRCATDVAMGGLQTSTTRAERGRSSQGQFA